MRLDDAARDLRLALRMLRRAPGYSALAIATLALGIGATSTVFSLVNAWLLRPLPLLGLIAAAASYIPARRAARTDPMLALRAE